MGNRPPHRLRAIPIWALLGALAWSNTANAQTAPTTAGEHFEQGYRLAQSGSFEAAIEEFKRAYELSPNYSVLFNLGQAYGAMGRSVDAERTLQEYLKLGGASIDAEQRRRTAELIRYYQRRIGRLAISGLPNGAVVHLDSTELGAAPFSQPLEVTSGAHLLSAQAAGYLPLVRVVEVKAGELLTLQLALNAELRASLRLDCELPDVELRIDGVTVATTPQREPVPLATGSHHVALSRPGYATLEKTLTWEAGQARSLSCALNSNTPPHRLAPLRVRHPNGTQVSVDGRPFTRSSLPPGAHIVSVSGGGYETETRRVELTAGRPFDLTLTPLRSAVELERTRRERARILRGAAWAVGGAAVLAGGAAIALAVENAGRYSRWRDKDKAFTTRVEQDPSSTSVSQLEDLLTEENSIRNRDALALGLGVGAATLAVTSVALYVIAGSGTPTASVGTRGEVSFGYRGAF